jgi:hypothetical protein
LLDQFESVLAKCYLAGVSLPVRDAFARALRKRTTSDVESDRAPFTSAYIEHFAALGTALIPPDATTRHALSHQAISGGRTVTTMTKQQRLRATAEGFMAGLVACGYRGPWRWSNLEWEPAFYRAWRDWWPQQRTPKLFPAFELGGHGHTSQAREMLWQLKRTSPFHGFHDHELPTEPMGLDPREYIEIWVDTAEPDEWIALASAFLTEINTRAGSRG